MPGPHLIALERAGLMVRPGPGALRYAQDKRAMRERVAGLGIACPRSATVTSLADVLGFADGSGWPVVLKAVTGGYDGKGVWVCGSPDEAAAVLAHGLDLLAEEHVAIRARARRARGPLAQRPGGRLPGRADHPAGRDLPRGAGAGPGLAEATALEAERLGLAIAAGIGVTGMLAVELFETPAGLLVNELAMRPHNSGHWTIEGARTSQFEQHLRAVLDLPLGAPTATAPHVVMANVLGGDDPDLHARLVHVMAADPGVKVHLYGKAVRPGRKIGHVTAAR